MKEFILKNKKLLIGIAVVIIAIWFIYWVSNKNEDIKSTDKKNQEVIEIKTSITKKPVPEVVPSRK